MDYEEIKQLARDSKLRVTDLIALAPANDPFYVGAPASVQWGEWFADVYKRFGFGHGIHLRRVHYAIISQETPIQTPDGKPYENTDHCWGQLLNASKQARYLSLVDAEDFDDKKHAEPTDYDAWVDTNTRLSLDQSEWFSPSLPEFPALPTINADGFAARQRYRLEIWCEKSTMNDVIIPLAQQYGATVQIGVGELSITRVVKLIRRIEADDRPARIFYISDFDPAGKSMPVAVARKLEFFASDLGLEIDAKVFPLVLTEEQCTEYRLPRTPIKETEMRARAFEERFGSGATELDALEALHPGVLRAILGTALQQYYDPTLARRVQREYLNLLTDLTERAVQAREPYSAEIAELQDEYTEIAEGLRVRLSDWEARRSAVWEAISARLEDNQPDMGDWPVPEPDYADESDGAMYDSERSYMRQLQAYKEFQGK